MNGALKKGMVWVGVMLHDPWKKPKKTDFGDTVHGIDTWLF